MCYINCSGGCPDCSPEDHEPVLCWGQSCPQRRTCYRYLFKPSGPEQAYFTLPPFKEDMTCDYYWPVGKNVVDSKSRIKRINTQLQTRSSDIQTWEGDSEGPQQD